MVVAMGVGFWFTRRFIESKEEQDKFQQLAEETLLEIIPPKASEPSSRIPEPSGAPLLDADPEAPLSALEPVHDIAALQRRNPNCLGWITVPGTPIDYPVMWTPAEPEFYLNTAFDGTYSAYGVPFLDGRCQPDSDNLILYSHNKFDGTMFTALIHYGDQSYFEEHRTIIFETLDGVRQYNIFAVCRANAYSSQIYKSIVFFDWDLSGDCDHVGIVEKVGNGRVYTIEGNSGDACRRCSYPVGYNQIVGYGIIG